MDAAVTDVDVMDPVDSSWRKRGPSYFHGTVTAIAIESGKILDSDIMSHNCQSCNSMENLRKTDSAQYNKSYI